VPPAPRARINDYAGALSAAERAALEQRVAGRERGTSSQVAVAIFRSLEGESLEAFSIRLAEAWRLGGRGTDNGVILLVFLQERKTRIEVGYGLEATLTDAIAGSILRDVVAPRFREGKLADGIGAALDAIQAAIAGQYRIPPSGRGGRGPGLDAVALPFVLGIIVIAALAGFIQAARRSQIRRGGWTGGARGWGGPSVGGPWIGGGGWGGGGSSGGGSDAGGFSGGGGGFGGGGASGDW
jgi:uncharacterized protein